MQTLAHGSRVEPEKSTDAFEGVRPVSLIGEEPLLRLVEETATATVRGEAILLEASEGIVENGNHEPPLGWLRA